MDKLDLEIVRWKTVDNLTPEEGEFLVKNKEHLNDEEKDAFADLLRSADPLPDLPIDEEIKQKEIEEQIEDQKPAVETTPALPDDVVRKDQLDSYMDAKRKEWNESGKSKVEQAKEEVKIKELFAADYVPKDWNDYTNAMFEKVAPLIEQKVLATLEAKNKEIFDNNQKIQSTQKEIYNRFEQEFATLAKSKMIPDPKHDPQAYKAVHDAIIKIGDENGKNNVTDAYKLWSIIPKEHGGGYGVTPEVAAKQKIEAQKQVAGKIGSARGAGGSLPPTSRSYEKIHNTRMDDLLEQRLLDPT